MHKMRMVGLSFGLLLMLAAAGCNNDDCASCPDAVTPLGHAKGWLVLTPGTRMPELEVFGNGSVAPNLDSVKVGDSLVNRQEWQLAEGPNAYADAHLIIPFYEDGDPSTFMYDPGDTAIIRVWGEGRSSFCRVKLLYRDSATVHITTPTSMADTIAPGGSDTVYWNRVEHADYYAIMVPWWVTPGYWFFTYYYATDTSFIITGDMMPDSVTRFDVQVTPFNGPDPRTDKTNWSGKLLDGVVICAGQNSYTTIIVRSPMLSPREASSQAAEERPKLSSEEIVANVYKQCGR